MATRETTGLYLGAQDAEFNTVNEAFTKVTNVVQRLIIANTLEEARKFLDTQTITVIVVNLHLDRDQTAAIIEAIRQERPYMKIFAVMPFPDVVAHNCWCIARGINGTITVDQFRDAIGKIVVAKRWRALLIALGVFSMVGIVSATLASTSPFVRFLGVFWVIALLAECIHYVLSQRREAA